MGHWYKRVVEPLIKRLAGTVMRCLQKTAPKRPFGKVKSRFSTAENLLSALSRQSNPRLAIQNTAQPLTARLRHCF